MTHIDQTLVKEFQTELLNSFYQVRQEIIALLMDSVTPNDQRTVEKMHNLSSDELLEVTSNFSLPTICAKTSSIKKIDAALNNIEIDMYGLCSDCEEEIDIEQLKLDPTQQRCAKCESKYQKQRYNNFKL